MQGVCAQEKKGKRVTWVCLCLHVHNTNLLMNVSTVRLHLLDNRGEFVKELLVGVQGEQVFLSEQEAKAVPLRPAQAVT